MGRDSKIISQTAAIRKKKYSIEYGQFAVEGKKAVFELFNDDAFRISINYIIFSEKLEKRLINEIVSKKITSEIKFYLTSDEIFSKISDTESPEGIIAVCAIPEINAVKILGSLANTNRPLAILLDSVNDPGNLGTIIRLSDNFNAAGIFLAGNSVYEYSGKVIRSTMGSFKNTPVARLNNEDYPALEKFFSQEGNFIVTTELNADTSAYDLEPILKRRGAKKILLIAGSESHGIINEDIKKMINNCKNIIRVKIPCHGKNESLNLSVATGILCYEISRYINAK